MSPRLVALLCALCALSADAAPTCPKSGSSAAISCYSGSTYSGAAPAGGKCSCKCGLSAAVADYDYFLSATNYQTIFGATSSAACTAAACTSKFPKFCGQAASVTPVYTTYAATLAAAAPVSKSVGANTICTTVSEPCSSASNPCSAFGLTSGNVIVYSSLTDNAVTGSANVQCALGLGTFVADSGSTVLNLCTTNNCNAPGATSVAVRGGGATAFVAAAALAALAL